MPGRGFLGECNKETNHEMLNYFYDIGGNFIDTVVHRSVQSCLMTTC